jgi:hypothetical protein
MTGLFNADELPIGHQASGAVPQGHGGSGQSCPPQNAAGLKYPYPNPYAGYHTSQYTQQPQGGFSCMQHDVQKDEGRGISSHDLRKMPFNGAMGGLAGKADPNAWNMEEMGRLQNYSRVIAGSIALEGVASALTTFVETQRASPPFSLDRYASWPEIPNDVLTQFIGGVITDKLYGLYEVDHSFYDLAGAMVSEIKESKKITVDASVLILLREMKATFEIVLRAILTPERTTNRRNEVMFFQILLNHKSYLKIFGGFEEIDETDRFEVNEKTTYKQMFDLIQKYKLYTCMFSDTFFASVQRVAGMKYHEPQDAAV